MYLTIDVIDDEARRYDHGEEGDLEIELGIDIHRVVVPHIQDDPDDQRDKSYPEAYDGCNDAWCHLLAP